MLGVSRGGVAFAVGNDYYGISSGESDVLNLEGVLRDSAAFSLPYTAMPGNYTLSLTLSLAGSCDGGQEGICGQPGW